MAIEGYKQLYHGAVLDWWWEKKRISRLLGVTENQVTSTPTPAVYEMRVHH